MSDIIKTEVRPNVAKWVMDKVEFYVTGKSCAVYYKKVDDDENDIGENERIVFTNEEDGPQEFNQLIQAINNGSDIKQTITNAVKVKLGIS